MRESLVYVQNIDSSVLEQTLPSPPSLSWLQYWVAHAPFVWRDADLFRCPICKRMFYKNRIEIVRVQITALRTAPNTYRVADAEERSSIYLTPVCPMCAKELQYEWKVNKDFLVLVPQKE